MIQFLVICKFIRILIKYDQCFSNSRANLRVLTVDYFPQFFAVQLGDSCYIFSPCWVSLSRADPSWSHAADSLW